MQLRQFYNIATKVSSRKKCVTGFGDLPDCSQALEQFHDYPSACEVIRKIGVNLMVNEWPQ